MVSTHHFHMFVVVLAVAFNLIASPVCARCLLLHIVRVSLLADSGRFLRHCQCRWSVLLCLKYEKYSMLHAFACLRYTNICFLTPSLHLCFCFTSSCCIACVRACFSCVCVCSFSWAYVHTGGLSVQERSASWYILGTRIPV